MEGESKKKKNLNVKIFCKCSINSNNLCSYRHRFRVKKEGFANMD